MNDENEIKTVEPFLTPRKLFKDFPKEWHDAEIVVMKNTFEEMQIVKQISLKEDSTGRKIILLQPFDINAK